MDQRFGAYAQLLALFRMVHDGAKTGDDRNYPGATATLFDPDRYRIPGGPRNGRLPARTASVSILLWCLTAPSTGCSRCWYVLDGERISYRALDVEHVGSVYETMMGFRLETAQRVSPPSPSSRQQKVQARTGHNQRRSVCSAETPARRARWVATGQTDRTVS